ncbi:MAG: tetratricopeptide repeat protein [Chloroflexi bacterium]|nr:tetratricopeptide repeat protein [Chloroflexota bacterium]
MPKNQFQIGELIENRYRVLDVIGKGGMGTLYRVADEARDGEIVALKMVRIENPGESREQVKYFQNEFQLLTQLRHPNLVSVYDYGITTGGKLYFTMEWAEGRDLDPHGRRMALEDSVSIVVQVCRALAYLHSRGVIHGDLKPANVLLSADTSGQVKIIDFGIALEMRSVDARARYYSPGYSAPEMKDPHPVDHRADLYSLGALWYTLLVGEPPIFMFGAERLIEIALGEVLAGHDWANTGNVITQLLATAPGERYISANEVIEVINKVTGSDHQLETKETASSYALQTHFVNREAEVEVLQEVWEQVRSESGKLILISGGSGVGKSRLVREQEVQAELQGARVVWGQCVESGSSAYHPWREVLRVLVRYVEVADKEVMLQVGPVLATILAELWNRDYMAGLPVPVEIEAQAAKSRLNNAIVRMLHTAASLRPTMVVVENVHWADEATLELLGFLVRIPMPSGLLVYATYRSEEIGPDNPLLSLSGDRVLRIPLQPLSSEVTADLVRSMLGLEQVPSLLMERVQRTTGGNAFFVQELIRSLAVEGKVLQRTVEGWRVDGQALRETELPQSIRQVLDRRLVQLSVQARETLAWAAVMGLVFWESGAAEIGQVAQAQVRAALRDLMDQGLVVVRDETVFAGEQEYLFLNPTVREAGYESIPREMRQEHHSRAAAWLMIHSDDNVGEHLSLIADHLEKAGQVEQAVNYLRRAGEQAAVQFANAEALAHLSHALDLIAQDDVNVPIAERYALLLAREKVYEVQGAREAQAQDLAVLEQLAQALDADAQYATVAPRRAEVALCRASYAEVTGDFEAAIAAAQTAIDLAQAAGQQISERVINGILSQGYMWWGRVLQRQGKHKEARSRLEQALDLSMAAAMHKVEIHSLITLGTIYLNHYSDSSQAKVYYEQALGICREVGDRRSEGTTLRRLGNISLGYPFLPQNSYSEAIDYYTQSLHVCREIGYREGESGALNNLGEIFHRLGKYDDAQTCYEQSLHIFGEIGSQLGVCIVLGNLGLLSHNLADHESAEKYSRRALLIARELGIPEFHSVALINLGHTQVGLGQMAQAVESYQQALALRRDMGLSHKAMESLAGIARVSLIQENLTQAQARVEEILGYVENHTLHGEEDFFQIYLTCYHVLHASNDRRAQDILTTAYVRLQEQADKITNDEMRRSFLENVAVHREIVDEWTNQPSKDNLFMEVHK